MISREQLQSIEWAIKDEDGGSWCPACASPADIGHKCDCWLARALAAPPADGSETGWVIERDINSVLHYWTGRVIDGREIGAWSVNHLDARRFARRGDATCMLTWHCGGQGRVVEHVWSSVQYSSAPPAASGPPAAPPETVKCWKCLGRGSFQRFYSDGGFDAGTCLECRGTGRIPAPPVVVPADADDSMGLSGNIIILSRKAREELRARSDGVPGTPTPSEPECMGPFTSAFDCPKCDPRKRPISTSS